MAGAIDYSMRRFLIVDDESFMLGMIERVLRGFGAGAILKAGDGMEALRCIKDQVSQVDCIIADFNMKPVNGLQLLQAVRTGANPQIPRDQAFIMLTGHGDTDVVKTAITLDVNGYLVKPVAPDKLAQTLQRIFSKATDLKAVEHYRAINIGAALSFNDAEPKRPNAWVMLLKKGAASDHPVFKEKIERFRKDNATRDRPDDIKIKNLRQCDINELKANVILAEDVEGEEGALLLRRGTTLTANLITRLQELAVESESRTFIWIGDPT